MHSSYLGGGGEGDQEEEADEQRRCLGLGHVDPESLLDGLDTGLDGRILSDRDEGTRE